MNIGFVGVGKMAGAILEGILKNNIFIVSDINLYDPYSMSLYSFEKMGCNVYKEIDELVNHSDLIIIAVKPNQIKMALDEITVDITKKCFISIAAGISIEYLKSILGEEAYVIRVMPNTPLMVGCGATAIALSDDVPLEFREKAVYIFSSSGAVAFLEEELINAVTAINGSSPAYFFSIAEEMVRTATELGIDPDSALMLTAKTMEGASRMLLESGKSPAELVRDVSSPNGTTVAALEEMKKLGFYSALKSGMIACINRAKEIGK